ncbi:MAG: PKD domain-containing protein [Chitinophagales bacterium]|nr:PKD domain-containing protein [Chitinophagales bacterium]
MKKILCLLIAVIFLSASIINAQSIKNRTNFWHFNFNCAIDFNSGSPVSLNNSALYNYEGTTSISDSNGNLLFYNGGGNIYNKNNQVLVNGSGLTQGNSASQACLAVPLPGTDSIWYLFTVADGGSQNKYSIIDMSLQSGLGEVTQKNLNVFNSGEEKITGCLHANGIDYWVLFKKGASNKYNVYPVTSAGVGAGIQSTTGPVNVGGAVGCMKLSPDGSKLAIANYSMHSVDVLDFDIATGLLTFDYTIYVADNFWAYVIEWSCDGKRLYLGNVDYYPGEVYQLDMTQPTDSLIIASKTVLSSTNDILGTLQMGPDGKIYINRYNVYNLAEIENPDALGAACNYVNNGFSTSPHTNYLGLPNYIVNWLGCSIGVPDFSVSDNSFCANNCIDFTDQSTNSPTAWDWSFPGGLPNSSSAQNPTNICYGTSGVYDVTLITTGANGNDTITFTGYITVNATPSANITQAGNVLSSDAADSYQWYFDSGIINGATNQSYTATQSGWYAVTIDSNGCTAIDSFYFSLTQFGSSDTDICQKFCTDYYDFSQNNPVSWKWTFEGGSPSTSILQNPTQICYNTPGTYDVTLITTNGLGISDTLLLADYMAVNATPPLPTITQNGYVLTSSPANNYQWQFNSIDISGATQQSYTATETGFYTVVISNETGCVSSNTLYVLVTGMEDISGNEFFAVYPNPSKGLITVEFMNSQISEATITVTNALGQILFTSNPKNITAHFTTTIDLGAIAAGVYFLELSEWTPSGKSHYNIFNKKILITH